MDITEKLKIDNIFINLSSVSKSDVLKEIIWNSTLPEEHKEHIYEKVLEREEIEPTAVGNGIGIAHAKVEVIDEIEILMGLAKEGIDYEAYDENPVKIIFVIVAPAQKTKDYLNVMSKISRICRNAENIKRILDAKSNFDVWKFINDL